MNDATSPLSALEQSLRAGAFVLTAEVVPPASCDADDLRKKALPLRGLADAVNVTDGAGARAHMGATAAAAILVENGIEPILQLACRDRNRIALQGELMGAAATRPRATRRTQSPCSISIRARSPRWRGRCAIAARCRTGRRSRACRGS